MNYNMNNINPIQFMNSLNAFKQSLGSNPVQYAQQMINQMLNNGQLSQESYNQNAQLASMIQQKFNIY